VKGRAVASMVAAIMIAASTDASDALILAPDESRLVSEPTVAVNHQGAMVVVWASRVAKGRQPLNGIRLQRFGPDGTAVGDVFRIDALPGDLAAKPAVDMAPDGSRFVVVWEGGEDGKRTKRRIWAQVFDAAGRLVGQEIRVDQRRMMHERWGLPRDYYRDPRVSVAPSGEFVVVWRSEGRTSCDRFNISARRFSPDGEPIGDEFIVNTERKWSQLNPDVDHDASGGFVVAWQTGRFVGTDRERSRIVARSFDASGTARGGEVVLNPDSGEAATLPSLVVAPNGSFACAWKNGSDDRGLERMGAGVFDAGGAPLGAPIVIEPETPGRGGPQLTIVGDFELMVAWNGTANDRLESPAVVAQVFNPAGAATAEPFPLSPATCWTVEAPQVAGSRGYGAVVWKSELDDRIAVRRFDSAAPWADAPLQGGGRTFSELVATGRSLLVDKSLDQERRTEAMNFLSCMRQTASSAAEDFRRCLSDEKMGLHRPPCCFGLASVDDSPARAVSTLLEVLGDEERYDLTRAAAACAIGWIGQEADSAAPALMGTLADENEQVRGCAARALGQIGATEAVDAIAAALKRGGRDPYLLELHQNMILGLADLSDDDRARDAILDYDFACKWLTEYVGWRNGGSDLAGPKGLKRYARYWARNWRVRDSVEIDRLVQDARRCIDGGLVGKCGNIAIPGRSGVTSIDSVVMRYQAILSLQQMQPCDCLAVLARGLSEINPIPEWAGYRYSELFRLAASRSCLPDILEMTEHQEVKDDSVSAALVVFLRDDEVPVMPVLRALAATDPSCEQCIVELKRLFGHPDPEIVEVAIRALIKAGPEAIRGSKLELVEMLDVESTGVREAAEETLDLIEIDAEVCDADRAPVEPSASELVGQPGPVSWEPGRTPTRRSPPN